MWKRFSAFVFCKDGQMVKAAAVVVLFKFSRFCVASVGRFSHNTELWDFATDGLFHGIMNTIDLHTA